MAGLREATMKLRAAVPSSAPRAVPSPAKGSIRSFIDDNFKHFNAAALRDAAIDYEKLLRKGGRMFVSLAGAMSTGELGRSLAEMIRRGYVHGVSCTGANLEEDIFLQVAYSHYERFPRYHDLLPKDEVKLKERHINRVTDVGIPEKAAMKPIEDAIGKRWEAADKSGTPKFPHEFLWDILDELRPKFEADEENSWVLAAREAGVPIYVPGWEDSTLGNVFAAKCMNGEVKNVHTVKGGVEYMIDLTAKYKTWSKPPGIGFFQIGGGIPGDFAICVVPLLQQDADPPVEVPIWSYFCQITDADESYGGYSGAAENEKITWGKIGPETPRHVVKSDATICAPLIFAYLLGW